MKSLQRILKTTSIIFVLPLAILVRLPVEAMIRLPKILVLTVATRESKEDGSPNVAQELRFWHPMNMIETQEPITGYPRCHLSSRDLETITSLA